MTIARVQSHRAAEEFDPDIGSIKRRFLRRQKLGIRPVGPTEVRPPPTFTHFDGYEIAAPSDQSRHAEIALAHRRMVELELVLVDSHAASVRKRLQTLGASQSYERQECAAELAMLESLRAALEADSDKPLTHARDGKPLDPRMREFLRARAKELAEQLWREGTRAAAAGDHRRARRLRLDSLRARHIAELESGLRASLPGYSSAWS
jgi:hypothetical protein